MVMSSTTLHAFSISGYLQMKQLGGALMYLRPRRRFYFAIDEIKQELLWYRQEADFTSHRDPLGSIPIQSAYITISENNDRAFVLHVCGKSIELEADNIKSSQCWLEAFSNRSTDAEKQKLSLAMLRKSKRSVSLPDQDSFITTNKFRLCRKNSSPARQYFRPIMPKLFGEEKLPLEFDLPEAEITDWVSQWLRQEKFNSISDNDLDVSTTSSNNQSSQVSMSGAERSDNEELEQLRLITNSQKKKIEEMKAETNALTMHLEQMRMRNDSANGTTRDTLSGQNKFLNSEVLRVSAKCDQLENELTRIKKDYHQTHEDLQTLRCDYIYAIQSAIQIPLHDNSGLDVMNVKLIGGETHVDRILKLLAEARREDPSLPTLKSVLQGSYVDSFGFRVCYKEEPLALHYLATKLHHFYLSRSSSFVEHKLEWRNFLEEQTEIELTKETKHLCRNGIPNSLRSTVWKILINQQVDDLKLLYGKYYYRNLCNTRGGEDEQKFSENHQKQINLDLLRTMPNNVHFMSATSKGISQLQQVLRAFCLHNPEIGYCQGMNFLTATALLFVGPEDAFWFLIAITEKYFDKTYFDSNLTGAQADQEVLKEMLEAQHPRITRHLNSLDIDVASISLNWFIALFFDAVPFNTMLRIWDCFLLEGPKVLFRFALVLLGKHENEIISRNDAIGIMRVSKAASRLAFDEHAVVEMAFSIKNLPTRAELKTLQTQYVVALSEKLERRSKRAAAFVNSISPRSNNRLISNIFMNEFCSSSGFIVSGHHMMGKVAKIQIQNDKAEIKEIDIEFDCRVMSICMAQRDLVYVSLISGFLILAYVDSMDNWSIMWELKLPDVAVCLIQRDGTLFAALANGTLSVFENACEKWPTNVQMWHLPLSSAPLVNAVIQDDLLVVASSCKLITLDALSLTILNTTHVASCSASSGNIYFDKISCMCDSPYGIFLSTDQSTLIQLWNEVTCNLLYEVSFDHKNRKPSLSETESNVHINSILYNSGFLWIGTSDGYVIIYNVFDDGLQEADGIQYRLKRFSSERKYARTSQMKLRKLGSLKEHREEDSDDSDHMGVFSHRVRINIDPEKQQYKVASVTVDKEEEDDEGLQQGSSRVNSACAKILRSPLNKGLSGDSAVSVFSSEPCVEQTTLENRVDDLFLQPKMALHHPHNRIASTDSSCTSMEYDDIFELYSDEDRSRRRVAITSPKRIGCNKKIQLKRKDLAFDEPYIVPIPVKGTSRDSACDADTSIVFPKVRLSLLMKLKVSDSSVRKIVAKSESHVLTCSGEFGADEAVLLWKQDPESFLWYNDPVITHGATKQSTSPNRVTRSA